MAETFRYVPCPNCRGETRRSGGSGFSAHSAICPTEPLCIICINLEKMIICYACNRVSSYWFDGEVGPNCDSCSKDHTPPSEPPCKHIVKSHYTNGSVCNECLTILEMRPEEVEEVEPTPKSRPRYQPLVIDTERLQRNPKRRK